MKITSKVKNRKSKMHFHRIEELTLLLKSILNLNLEKNIY